jgi:predicted dehydrogenase|uniref:Gfo/Idh/MocA family oxidoreductase n=1 Tax=Anaerolinea thermolimosa TaxID=229919 RepID=A0A7C4KJD4_9CHLR
MNKDRVKLAVIGVGNMGSFHVRDLAKQATAELVAICDIDREKADRYASEFGVPAFYDYRDMLDRIALDGVVIATPHYDHTPISIDAFQRGLHVLVEKPIAVHVKDARKMIAAYQEARKARPDLVFAIMFQQRTYGFWRKIKSLIDDGELGKLVRATWIITDWFRTQAYYDSGGWRATWRGEGGGVLLNQCPHNLDLFQWFTGMPRLVAGFASIGKYHNIEVEDEVTGYFEYENGLVGHFITTTAESPGTNRLEIVGENGKLVFEDGKLTFVRNRQSMFTFSKTSKSAFDKVEAWEINIPYHHHGEGGHRFILENFAKAILFGEPLIARGEEGLNSLTLSNAMMLSSWLKKPVELPFDEDEYEARLMELVRTSRFQKPAPVTLDEDLNKSFGFH